jgi:LysR family transcriptional regulator, hca operon transcriptional activator
MELRHLRYFVAIAEEGSLTVAAESRLHTTQPSLSRQIRDLEDEVGVPLMTRSTRGMKLTAAGQVFLDHARLALGQADAAMEAARRAAEPQKQTFSIGFQTGMEVDWLPQVTRILRDELPNIEVRVLSGLSPRLAEDVQRRKLDLGFLRREPQPDLKYRTVVKERLAVILPSNHRLAANKSIDPRDLAGETYIGFSDVPHILRGIVNRYLRKCGVALKPTHEIEHFGMGISLVASTGGVVILPAYAGNFLTSSVVSRPFKGEAPTIDLVIGYHRENTSRVLKVFLSRVSDLIARHAGRSS